MLGQFQAWFLQVWIGSMKIYSLDSSRFTWCLWLVEYQQKTLITFNLIVIFLSVFWWWETFQINYFLFLDTYLKTYRLINCQVQQIVLYPTGNRFGTHKDNQVFRGNNHSWLISWFFIEFKKIKIFLISLDLSIEQFLMPKNSLYIH